MSFWLSTLENSLYYVIRRGGSQNSSKITEEALSELSSFWSPQSAAADFTFVTKSKTKVLGEMNCMRNLYRLPRTQHHFPQTP